MAGLMLPEEGRNDAYSPMYPIERPTFVFRHGETGECWRSLMVVSGILSISLSNLLSGENERISCENLEKYGGLLSLT